MEGGGIARAANKRLWRSNEGATGAKTLNPRTPMEMMIEIGLHETCMCKVE
jgi:hypothetical protein